MKIDPNNGATTDISNVSVRLPMVLAGLAVIVTVLLGIWQVSAAADNAATAQTSAENTKAISDLAKQQAITASQITAILTSVQATQADARATHDAVIRLETIQQERDNNSHHSTER